MDPNLFHIDWPQLLEVLAALVVLSFVVERGLSLIFEHKYFVKRLSSVGIKEPIAFAAALLICNRWDFDVVSVLMRSETTSFLGQIITAAVVAGGSKASIKLFQDVLGVKSTAEQQKSEINEAAKLAAADVAARHAAADAATRRSA